MDHGNGRCKLWKLPVIIITSLCLNNYDYQASQHKEVRLRRWDCTRLTWSVILHGRQSSLGLNLTSKCIRASLPYRAYIVYLFAVSITPSSAVRTALVRIWTNCALLTAYHVVMADARSACAQGEWNSGSTGDSNWTATFSLLNSRTMEAVDYMEFKTHYLICQLSFFACRF